MRMIDPLLMELDRECATTRKLLARVPDDKLSWAPHAKSMTLGKLAWHLAVLPGWIGASALTDGWDFASGSQPPAPATSAEILAAFDANVASAKVNLAGLDDDKAFGLWTLSANGKEIFSMPRIALVRSILLNHSIHHRGQLSVYLRLLDIPVPAVYGPSADDNPFA